MRYLFSIGLPIATGVTLLADKIISLFYGDQFTSSVIALQILAWDALLFFLYDPLATTLASMNKQNILAITCGVCALVNVVLNLILIPNFSYIGAGIATIVTETVLLVLYFYFVSKYLYWLPLHKIILKPMVACALMAIFIYFLSNINLAVIIVSSAILYFIVLYILRWFSPEDFSLISQAIKYPKMRR